MEVVIGAVAIYTAGVYWFNKHEIEKERVLNGEQPMFFLNGVPDLPKKAWNTDATLQDHYTASFWDWQNGPNSWEDREELAFDVPPSCPRPRATPAFGNVF